MLFGLTKRQLVCFGSAALVGVPLFFLSKGSMGTTSAALCMILVLSLIHIWIEVHERDQKRARYAIQHISIYFNYIGKFENEVTQLAEPTEQEIRQMREEIEEAKKEKSRAYHRQYSREYRARNLEKQREYDRIKAREYRARRKAQAAAAQPTQ